MQTIDGESDVESGKRKLQVTSTLRHFCVHYYVREIVCVTALVACVVFVHDTRSRQSLIEQRLRSSSSSSWEGEGLGRCCRCCRENREPLGGPVQTNGGEDENRNSIADLLLSIADRDLVVDGGSDAGSLTSSGRHASLPVRQPIRVLRHRRDVEDLEASSSSSANETETDDGSTAVSPSSSSSSSPFSLSSSSSMTAETEISRSPEEVEISSSSQRPSLRQARSSTEKKTTRKQRNADKAQGKEKKKKKKRQQKPSSGKLKHSKESETNSEHHLAAIHLQAPDNFDRKYESGPAIQVNASDTRDTVYRFWRKANWVKESVSDVFHLDNETGHVTVEVEGIYMIYAQVVYHDLSGRWSFGVYVGDQERVKCLATEQLRDLHNYHPTSHGVYQSCYTALVLHIRKNQSVSIRCLYGSRTILTRSEFTFWGIVRLS